MLKKAQCTAEVATDNVGLRPVREVAQFLALSRSKVYQLMETGELPFVKLGKSRRVRWSDVLQLIEQNTIVRS